MPHRAANYYKLTVPLDHHGIHHCKLEDSAAEVRHTQAAVSHLGSVVEAAASGQVAASAAAALDLAQAEQDVAPRLVVVNHVVP